VIKGCGRTRKGEAKFKKFQDGKGCRGARHRLVLLHNAPNSCLQPVFSPERSCVRRGSVGMAAMSSAQSKCVDEGGGSRCSISSFCDSGSVLFRGCESSTRGVGAVGMRGVDIIDAGDAVGTGGLCCGMCSWGERGTAFWGKFLGCGGITDISSTFDTGWSSLWGLSCGSSSICVASSFQPFCMAMQRSGPWCSFQAVLSTIIPCSSPSQNPMFIPTSNPSFSHMATSVT